MTGLLLDTNRERSSIDMTRELDDLADEVAIDLQFDCFVELELDAFHLTELQLRDGLSIGKNRELSQLALNR